MANTCPICVSYYLSFFLQRKNVLEIIKACRQDPGKYEVGNLTVEKMAKKRTRVPFVCNNELFEAKSYIYFFSKKIIKRK